MLECPNERFKNVFLLRFGQFWSQPKDFCCDLKCGHNRGIDVTTCFFLSLVILVVTSVSLLQLSFLLYRFNVQHSWLRLMNCCCDQKNFQVSLNNQIHSNFNSPYPIKTNTIQFIFIISIFNQSIYYASYSKFKHKEQSKIPPNFQSCHIRDKIQISSRKLYCPFFVSFADWKFDCRCSLFCTFLLSCKTKKKIWLQLVMNKITQSY